MNTRTRADSFTSTQVPYRDQAIRIQQALETLYKGAGGHYHYADAAWAYIKAQTGTDLKRIIEELAEERMPRK